MLVYRPRARPETARSIGSRRDAASRWIAPLAGSRSTDALARRHAGRVREAADPQTNRYLDRRRSRTTAGSALDPDPATTSARGRTMGPRWLFVRSPSRPSRSVIKSLWTAAGPTSVLHRRELEAVGASRRRGPVVRRAGPRDQRRPETAPARRQGRAACAPSARRSPAPVRRRDGQWIAYTSNETGRVRGLRRAAAGGYQSGRSQRRRELPRWRADGKELSSLSTDLKIMSGRLQRGRVPELSAPKALFSGVRQHAIGTAIGRQPDGHASRAGGDSAEHVSNRRASR